MRDADERTAGSDIRTIEDLGANGLHPVQRAWMELNVPQCGYCQSGQIMQAAVLSKGNPHPSDQESTMSWREISAAAEPTDGFVRRSSWQRGNSHEHIENVSRRPFLKRAFGAGAFVLRCATSRPVLGQVANDLDDANRELSDPNLFVGIQPDGTVYIVAHRSEMGTVIRASLRLVLADDMTSTGSGADRRQAIGDKRSGDENLTGSRS